MLHRHGAELMAAEQLAALAHALLHKERRPTRHLHLHQHRHNQQHRPQHQQTYQGNHPVKYPFQPHIFFVFVIVVKSPLQAHLRSSPQKSLPLRTQRGRPSGRAPTLFHLRTLYYLFKFPNVSSQHLAIIALSSSVLRLICSPTSKTMSSPIVCVIVEPDN